MVTTPLPADLSQFVESEVAAGRYSSPDEVVHTALRLLKEQLEEWRRLKADIDAGFEEIERGEGIHISDEATRKALIEAIKQEGQQLLAAREAQG